VSQYRAWTPFTFAHVSEATEKEINMDPLTSYFATLIALTAIAVAIRLAYMAWRLNIAANHAEKNKRLLEYEKAQDERMKESYERCAPAIKKGASVAGAGITMLARMLMKKK
jgi:hypothetical protein